MDGRLSGWGRLGLYGGGSGRGRVGYEERWVRKRQKKRSGERVRGTQGGRGKKADGERVEQEGD